MEDVCLLNNCQCIVIFCNNNISVEIDIEIEVEVEEKINRYRNMTYLVQKQKINVEFSRK